MTATIRLINLLDLLFILKKYKNLSHKKNALTAFIALSVYGKSKKNSSNKENVIKVNGIISIKFHGDVKYFAGPYTTNYLNSNVKK
jgi:hypothetical protein